MGYIDKDYYRNTWHGTVIADDDQLNRLIDRASDIIDEVAGQQIGDTIDSNTELVDAQKTLIKKATASQVESLYLNGEFYNEVNTGGSIRLGEYSEAGKLDENSSGGGKYISDLARKYVSRAGLIFRGMTT